MRAARTGLPRGRQKEADLNDERLLRAAREVFAEQGWDAPVSAVAKRAGIGMGSLYRRFATKEDLILRIRLDAMDRAASIAEAAATEPDSWTALASFVHNALRPGQEGAFLGQAAGRSPDTPEINAASDRMEAAFSTLLERARSDNALRPDVTPADLVLLLEHLGTRLPAPAERVEQLRHRYAQMMLDALRAQPSQPLPGPAPHWKELRELWTGPADPSTA
ncbi:TetR/AcrR family transcriptional regulator [Kitasatospora phosalacinea]|uniref:TetR/AcrR family transcriptional regulator n=1 Tax=Kitasatospora phosalacinea TaxID=2065 RepID=A0ABW6GVA5_9ACTN